MFLSYEKNQLHYLFHLNKSFKVRSQVLFYWFCKQKNLGQPNKKRAYSTLFQISRVFSNKIYNLIFHKSKTILMASIILH